MSADQQKVQTTAADMENITQLDVSLNEAEEKELHHHGFQKIPVNLNEGTTGKKIYLWYKNGSDPGVTRIQTSFSVDMEMGLFSAGYQKINKNLNTGNNGDTIYLWYFKGSTEFDVPIKELQVSSEPKKEAELSQSGWETVDCDLNRKAGGNYVYLWVKRAQKTYIQDIAATRGFDQDKEMFQKGYIRMDTPINRDAEGFWIFMWYRQSTKHEGAIGDLQVACGDEEKIRFITQGYMMVFEVLSGGPGDPINVGTKEKPVYVVFKSCFPGENPVTSVGLVTEQAAVKPLKNVGTHVIQKSLNAANSAATEFLFFRK
ncbi:uncharacterized protein ACNS7B_011370 [Menidia menidia]